MMIYSLQIVDQMSDGIAWSPCSTTEFETDDLSEIKELIEKGT